MSDISIPGVTSRIESGKIIDAMMKLERIPLTRLEDQVEAYKVQKTAWQDINRKLSQLQGSARSLFGFENPFNEKSASSSDESTLTATAARTAVEDAKTIQVVKTAQADKFLTQSLDQNYSVPSGVYEFTIGDETVTISFKGGKLTDFAKQITDRSKGLLKASVFNDTKDTSILLLESTKTGGRNRIGFGEEALAFGTASGMLEKTTSSDFTYSLNKNALSPWTKPLTEADILTEDGKITLMPGADTRLPLPAPIPVSGSTLIQVEFSIAEIPTPTTPPVKPPPGPEIPAPGGVNFQEIEILNSPSQITLPPWQPPTPPSTVTDMNILFVGDGGSGAPSPLPPARNISGTQVLTVPLKDFADSMNSLFIRNNNSMKLVEVYKVRIFDPETTGDYRPLNAISRAQDAEFTVDGVPIVRESNVVDDVLPGVTLTLKREGQDPVDITIEPNRKLIKDSVISFVGYYNQLFTELNILSRADSSVIEAIEYFTPEEQEAATERLGSMQGDITLNQLRNSMQKIMMDPYDTGEDDTLRLLAQIGISTNSTIPGTSGGVDASRLKGYLEINERILDENIASRMPAVRNLFGRDRDGDLVTDTGVAYAVDAYVRPYTQSGGILASKLQNLDTQITRTNRDMASFTDKLVKKEQDLKNKYGQLEGTLGNLDRSSQAIDNFSNSLRGNK